MAVNADRRRENADTATRDGYFPNGCWEQQNNQQRFNGPTTTSVDAPLDVLPYFVRCESTLVVPPPSSTTTTTTGAAPVATPVPARPELTG